MKIPFCARCGHPLTTHALNRRAYSECSACGPCAFVPGRTFSRRQQAAWFLVLVVLPIIGLIGAGRFIQ